MADASGKQPPSKGPLKDRLDSWKEIAEYLSRDVTTVQRWEKRERMPVHRHVHDRISSVYAFRADLDTWMESRNLQATQETATTQFALEPETRPPELSSQSKRRLAFLVIAIAIGLSMWLHGRDLFWRNPIAQASFHMVTDFDGLEQAATISRDGRFVAFLSDRSGTMDIWVTQLGSGEFHNLTHGRMPGLVNPLIRNLGFSPDASLVTFWTRRADMRSDTSVNGEISTWAIPVLGGEPRPYLEVVAEFDWSRDGSRLSYHTPGPGDPLFVSSGDTGAGNQPIFTAPAGLHSHFPLWSPDATYLYFVQGTLPDKLDIWRVPATGGNPQRITSHDGRVSHPVLLDERTLLYLASGQDGSGPRLYGMDVERHVPHRLTPGVDRYTSLAASSDGRRLVATLATQKRHSGGCLLLKRLQG